MKKKNKTLRAKRARFIASRVGYTLVGLFLFWVFASYWDIISHNTSTYTYASWNAFKIFF